MLNVNMSLPKNNFEGDFVFKCVTYLFLALSTAEMLLLDNAAFFMRKNLIYFVCVDVRILVEK